MSDGKNKSSGGCGCGSKKETAQAASVASGCCGGVSDGAQAQEGGHAQHSGSDEAIDPVCGMSVNLAAGKHTFDDD